MDCYDVIVLRQFLGLILDSIVDSNIELIMRNGAYNQNQYLHEVPLAEHLVTVFIITTS